jgi:6 kDa early secretory antigenic target
MTRYQVDSDAILSATSAARAAIGRLQGEVSSLTGQLTALQGSWQGSAATAFHTVLGEWTSTQQRIEQTLAALTEALGNAGVQYAEIEQANARLFMR